MRYGREARKWARTVKHGSTYYAIAEMSPGWPGPERRYLSEHTFDRRSPVDGAPMCGHMDALQVYATTGKLYEDRSHPDIKGLMTYRELSKAAERSHIRDWS
jgi:hypothetical protein